MQMHSPSHPGAILRAYMDEGLTVGALAAHLGITRANLSMVLNGRAGITASTAVKLAEAFPQSDAEFWLGLQAQYDLAQVRKLKRKRIRPVTLAAA